MKRGLNITLAEADAHQRKHGFKSILAPGTGSAKATSKASASPLHAGDVIKTVSAQKLPNNTEAEFGQILEILKRQGKIIRYEYEGITFKWLGMRYTPDWFVVVDHSYNKFWSFRAIEIKGSYIRNRKDLVRFKGARACWPEIQFEMWQRQKSGWKKIE